MLGDMPIVPYQNGGTAAGALNAPIPNNAATDPQSPATVDRLLNDLADTRIALEPSVAVYTAVASDPVWRVRCEGRDVAHYRIPQTARPGVPITEDGPMVVYDPACSPTSELRLWRAVPDPANLTMTAEGYGLFDSGPCGSGLPLYGWGTGSGLSSGAGLLRGWEVTDLLAGQPVRHALRIHAPAWCSGTWRLPATRSDQAGTGPLQMGARFQLQASDDQIASRTVPGDDPDLRKLLHAICRAARDYGLVVLDGVPGRQWTIPIEHPVTAPVIDVLRRRAPNGYLGNVIRDQRANRTGDGLRRRKTDGVPWERLRMLTKGTW